MTGAMFDPPFVLLDDARADGAGARLYRAPRRIVVARTAHDLAAACDALRAAARAGLHAAGFLSYEGAAALGGMASLPGDAATPLLWFGLFDGWEALSGDALAAALPDPAGAWCTPARPAIAAADHATRVAAVQRLIVAGDIYQANLTFAAELRIAGDPLSLYARLRGAAAAGHGALIDTGEGRLLSLSPELFFALDGEALTCRPMKGTAARAADPAADAAAAALLAADAKQRAENLMIVDLMRNDLARVAVPGSVAVPRLFAVETYPTVHQLTSTVVARRRAGVDALDVIAALVPCGSITGAPKRRASEVIAAVEDAPRGVYTGAIGRIDATGDATFNVAIRTLVIEDGGEVARMGLGSGIVADSQAPAEWAECLVKAGFVTAGMRPFDLFETMAFDPVEGVMRLEAHLSRLKASAQALGFAFDRHAARNELQAATFRLRRACRVRLLLSRAGSIAIETAPPPAPLPDPVPARLVPLPVAPADVRLRHKTSDRGFYDAARRDAGTAEVVFERADGWLTEGSFTSLFVERDGVLLTPPLSRGLLPGVLRAELIASGRAVEADLTRADLGAGVLLGNALRGLMRATIDLSDQSPQGTRA